MADRRPDVWSGLLQSLGPLHLLQQDFDEALLLCAVSRELISLTSEPVELCVRIEAQDLDVSITGLIATSQPLMDLATSLVASRNGRKSSAAKTAAARANGKKGGRPRKEVPQPPEKTDT